MPNLIDLQIALHDLAIATRLSCVTDDGIINAYEKDDTARVIALAITALAEIRENKKFENFENNYCNLPKV